MQIQIRSAGESLGQASLSHIVQGKLTVILFPYR